MEITGKIVQMLEERSGVSQRTGNPWKMQSYLLETMDQYPRHCVFEIFGEEKIAQMGIVVGQIYTVSIDIDAREYQGRWYNSIRAWRVMTPEQAATAMAPVQGGYAAPAQPVAAPQPAQTYVAPAAPAQPAQPAQPAAPASDPFAGDNGDLPF